MIPVFAKLNLLQIKHARFIDASLLYAYFLQISRAVKLNERSFCFQKCRRRKNVNKLVARFGRIREYEGRSFVVSVLLSLLFPSQLAGLKAVKLHNYKWKCREIAQDLLKSFLHFVMKFTTHNFKTLNFIPVFSLSNTKSTKPIYHLIGDEVKFPGYFNKAHEKFSVSRRLLLLFFSYSVSIQRRPRPITRASN